MAESIPPSVDIDKIKELLESTEQQQQIGRRIIRAIIIDVLKSKASGDSVFWIVRHLGLESCVAAVLQEIVDDVSLSPDELKILEQLESEDKPSPSPSGEKTRKQRRI
jgi:hypothetical protein